MCPNDTISTSIKQKAIEFYHKTPKNNFTKCNRIKENGFPILSKGDSMGSFYDDIKKEYLYEKIHRLKLPIKTILLDQSIICGIGNIYDDEILFMSGISPMRRGCDVSVSECQKIIDNTKEVLSHAVKLGGTTIKSFTSSEGVHGLFQNELLVHGKGGSPCPKCGRILEKTKIGGRGTHYCTNCQK